MSISRMFPGKKTLNTYIGYTITTLTHRLIYNLSNINAIEQHIMTKHNKDTDKHKTPVKKNDPNQQYKNHI